MDILRFYFQVFAKALRLTCVFFNLTSIVSVLRSGLLWLACTVFIMVFFETQLESRLETTLAFAMGIGLLVPFVFVLNLFYAPVILFGELRLENRDIKTDLKNAANVEVYLQELSELYYEGKEKYKAGFRNDSEKELWIHTMTEWVSLVEHKLITHFSVQTMHSFRNGGDFSYIRLDHVDTSLPDDRDLLSKFSHYIWNLNEVIEMNDLKCELSSIIKYADKET